MTTDRWGLLPAWPSMQQMITDRYRLALDAWAGNLHVQRAADTLGMTRREYCDRFIAQMPPIVSTSNTTNMLTIDWDAAYDAALAQEAGDGNL